MTDGPGFLGSFRFELRGSPPPLTLAEITALMAQIEAGKQRILCPSDVFEQVRDAVYGAGYGICFKVLECPWMDDGQVVVMPSETEDDAEMQALGRRMMDEITGKWEREFRAAEFFAAPSTRGSRASWLRPESSSASGTPPPASGWSCRSPSPW